MSPKPQTLRRAGGAGGTCGWGAAVRRGASKGGDPDQCGRLGGWGGRSLSTQAVFTTLTAPAPSLTPSCSVYRVAAHAIVSSQLSLCTQPFVTAVTPHAVIGRQLSRCTQTVEWYLSIKPSLRSSPVTPPRFRSLGQSETRCADEKVVTQ